MGGIGSGNYYRWGSRQTLDECRALDINRMVRLGAIQEGAVNKGQWLWIDRETNHEISKIGYECSTLEENNSYLRLSYKIIGTDHSVDYKIRLVRTYPNYGGVRFWFICPQSGRRVGKLYLVEQDGRFVSRHVYKIYYGSQMKGALDKAIDKKWKLMEKVNGTYFPERPKGMHQSTFKKIADQFYAQDNLCMRLIMQNIGVY